MPVTSSPTTPSTAERIRSVCVRASGAMLAVDGFAPVDTPVHHLLDEGAFAVTASADSAMAAALTHTTGVEAMLELTDYAALPLRNPVRSLVWIRGRLRSVPPPLVAALLDVIAAAYGLRLRVEAVDGDHDVRLPFTAPVNDARGLSHAIRTLVGCPFLNGLRARRI